MTVFQLTVPSFTDELVKIAFKLTQKGKQEVKAQRHFDSHDPDWKSFEKNLRSKHFQSAVKEHPQADEKLKRYVEGYGGYVTSKDVVGKAPSESSKRTYKLKRLADGRIACGCKDWQYKRSHGGSDCKHVAAFKASSFAEKVKQAFLGSLARAGASLAVNVPRAAIYHEHGNMASGVRKQIEADERQRKIQRKFG